MQNKIELTGKNVLVTGASQGIGACIAEAMASCGANVLINFRKEESKALAVAERLSNQYKVICKAYQADISIPEQVDGMFDFMDKQLGGIDILVNNAGIETINDALDMPLQEWDRIMNVNLRGAFYCAQLAGRRMRAKKQGVILNISSIHDKVARKGLVHYCSSKAGLNMLTKCLALELAEFNIRVMAVSPGAIETEMNSEEIEKFGRERFNNWIPLGKIGKVDDIAWMCSFLASDKAGYMTATEIYVDGGYKESTIQYDPR
ncbi:glucose 1-dehydrogenase [Chitinophagaceae bacterium LB-8]|uniref:Glucose 1-dehydrogenase n=1 Tax=Paraflavisolibacter caeni TaxID=2982496 RepID=A0A9X2XPU9_9BACT|nr:glucose 1-dehydrogenase [Paraflavisolibacter caeni]MCU7552238.1 glucose 1-dehydrogenase [Paraflavisolibacter caeni]